MRDGTFTIGELDDLAEEAAWAFLQFSLAAMEGHAPYVKDKDKDEIYRLIYRVSNDLSKLRRELEYIDPKIDGREPVELTEADFVRLRDEINDGNPPRTEPDNVTPGPWAAS